LTEAHIHVGKALVLGEQRATKRREQIRETETDQRIDLHVDALRLGHGRTRADRAHRHAVLRAEEPEYARTDYGIRRAKHEDARQVAATCGRQP
jgi:hypothetical protein